MHRLVKPILLGLLISTALIAAIFVSAVMGSNQAANLLLKLTLPPFNIGAMVLEPVAQDELERGGKMLDTLLMVAWLQISALAALLAAGSRAVILKSRR